MGVQQAIVDFRRDPHSHTRGIEARDPPDEALSRRDSSPIIVNPNTRARYHAEAGDYDTNVVLHSISGVIWRNSSMLNLRVNPVLACKTVLTRRVRPGGCT